MNQKTSLLPHACRSPCRDSVSASAVLYMQIQCLQIHFGVKGKKKDHISRVHGFVLDLLTRQAAVLCWTPTLRLTPKPCATSSAQHHEQIQATVVPVISDWDDRNRSILSYNTCKKINPGEWTPPPTALTCCYRYYWAVKLLTPIVEYMNSDVFKNVKTFSTDTLLSNDQLKTNKSLTEGHSWRSCECMCVRWGWGVGVGVLVGEGGVHVSSPITSVFATALIEESRRADRCGQQTTTSSQSLHVRI